MPNGSSKSQWPYYTPDGRALFLVGTAAPRTPNSCRNSQMRRPRPIPSSTEALQRSRSLPRGARSLPPVGVWRRDIFRAWPIFNPQLKTLCPLFQHIWVIITSRVGGGGGGGGLLRMDCLHLNISTPMSVPVLLSLYAKSRFKPRTTKESPSGPANMHAYMSLTLSLSLSLYVYIYIYI